MEFNIHTQVLLIVFGLGLVMGAVANKTHFCTMGAVSDIVNMGDWGRMRAWLLAAAVALLGVTALEASQLAPLDKETTLSYRAPEFVWLRYLLGGLIFGVGMTLASGCGNKTLVRIGGGNLKSLVVLLIAAFFVYHMQWGELYSWVFAGMVNATSIDLAARGFASQTVGDLTGTGNLAAGLILGLAALVYIFVSKEFRENRDHLMAGIVIGLVVVAGWYVTGGNIGAEWREWADFAEVRPSSVEVQSFTFMGPMGDSARYLMDPANLSLINFGIIALLSVIIGSFLWSLIDRSLRLEWFASRGDFVNHAVGATLMGIGGPLAMGCTVGQGITGVSTLALGSLITLLAICAGAAATMRVQYSLMMREA